MALVDMVVADDMLDVMPEAARLMKARERAHRPADTPGMTVVTLEIDGAPAGARGVEPVFEKTDGTVRVRSMNWQYEGSP